MAAHRSRWRAVDQFGESPQPEAGYGTRLPVQSTATRQALAGTLPLRIPTTMSAHCA